MTQAATEEKKIIYLSNYDLYRHAINMFGIMIVLEQIMVQECVSEGEHRESDRDFG